MSQLFSVCRGCGPRPRQGKRMPLCDEKENSKFKARNSKIEVIRQLAITRIITKDTNLPATTAMGVLKSEGQRKALLAGANVIMPNLTPPVYKCHYQVYPGKEYPALEIEATKNMILTISRRIGRGKGHRIRSRPA
jgi:biotin synthase-like enzyme